MIIIKHVIVHSKKKLIKFTQKVSLNIMFLHFAIILLVINLLCFYLYNLKFY